MQVKDILKYFNKHTTLLDISAYNSKTKECDCFSCKINKVPKKYLNYYIGYMATELCDLSYCCRHRQEKTCLLLDIFDTEDKAEEHVKL